MSTGDTVGEYQNFSKLKNYYPEEMILRLRGPWPFEEYLQRLENKDFELREVHVAGDPRTFMVLSRCPEVVRDTGDVITSRETIWFSLEDAYLPIRRMSGPVDLNGNEEVPVRKTDYSISHDEAGLPYISGFRSDLLYVSPGTPPQWGKQEITLMNVSFDQSAAVASIEELKTGGN